MAACSGGLPRRALALVCLAGLSAVAAAAENDPGASVVTHVDRISVRQSGATPMITVTAAGGEYDTVAADKFSMHYDASVTCKGLWDVHYFEVALGPSSSWYDVKGNNYQHKPIGSYTDLLASWGVDTGDKSRSVSGRTLIGPMKPQLRDAAINACRAEVEKAAAKNGVSVLEAMETARQLPLPKSGWVGANLRLQAWASCGMPQDQITWLSVFDSAPDVTVRCEKRERAHGVDTGGMPGSLAAPFQVTALSLKADPAHFQGRCPKELVLTGTVAANRAGAVKYRWRIGNTLSPPATLTFMQAQSRQVTRKMTLDHSWQRSITLLTEGPGKTESNSVEVAWSCLAADGPGNLAPRPPAPPPPLPPPPPPKPPTKPDLVAGPSLSVGNRSAQWGHTLTVNASQSELPMQGNGCGLALAYDVRNVGGAGAGPSRSRLWTGAVTLHTANVAPIAAGATRQVTGVLYLANGDYPLGLAVDHQYQVKEADEANNGEQVLLKVRNCSHPHPGNGQP